MIKLSLYMITKNEEVRLEKTLAAASQVADEIIIVDCGSTDGTEKIAKKFGAKFVFHKWKDHSDQKHFAENLCTNDWHLHLDADEVLSPALIEEIKAVKKNPEYKVYKLRIADVYPGQTHPSSFYSKYKLERLYHKDYAEMRGDRISNDRITLKANPDGTTTKIKLLKNQVYHYSVLSLSHAIQKQLDYQNELVKKNISTGKKYSPFALIFMPPLWFFKFYILRRGVLQGWWGLILAVNDTYFKFIKVAKNYEYISLQKIEKNNKVKVVKTNKRKK